MRIHGPAPNRVDESKAARAAEPLESGGDASTTAPPSPAPDSLVDVRLIANPEIVRARPPVQTSDDARAQAGAAARALKASPQKAAQVAGNVRPEAAAAAMAPPEITGGGKAVSAPEITGGGRPTAAAVQAMANAAVVTAAARMP